MFLRAYVVLACAPSIFYPWSGLVFLFIALNVTLWNRFLTSILGVVNKYGFIWTLHFKGVVLHYTCHEAGNPVQTPPSTAMLTWPPLNFHFSHAYNQLIILVKIKWGNVYERNLKIESLWTKYKNLWFHEIPILLDAPQSPFLGDGITQSSWLSHVNGKICPKHITLFFLNSHSKPWSVIPPV